MPGLKWVPEQGQAIFLTEGCQADVIGWLLQMSHTLAPSALYLQPTVHAEVEDTVVSWRMKSVAKPPALQQIWRSCSHLDHPAGLSTSDRVYSTHQSDLRIR